jgi:hypothetical protein
MYRTVAAALVAVLALGVASCGGSGTTTLTRAELVRRVEVACREGQRASQKVTRASAGGRSAFIQAILASQRTVMDRLEDLEASDAAKTDFAAFKSGVQTRLSLIQRVASADSGDQQRAMEAVRAKAEAATRRVTEAARRLGVDGCI